MAHVSIEPLVHGIKRPLTPAGDFEGTEVGGASSKKLCLEQKRSITENRPTSFLDLSYELREKVYIYYHTGKHGKHGKGRETFRRYSHEARA